ncbi:MAG TPA: hypothetical protein ENK06_10920, partial [Gammaproteobacteria bacterium]|nr:hypothetical protein [Gammaproteobacteria bacterium]
MSLIAVVCGEPQREEKSVLKRLFPEGACLGADQIKTLRQDTCLFAWQASHYAHSVPPLWTYQTPDKSLTVLFNGRIFNAAEIAQTLLVRDARNLAELLAQGYLKWGRDVLPRLRGQFAFVLRDELRKHVFAARDPFGLVPLYFSRIKDGLALTTTAKQLYRLDESNSGPNDALVAEYLTSDIYRNRLFNRPETLFNGVERVLPGHCLLWSDKGVEQTCYWNPQDIMRQPKLKKPDPEQYLALLKDVIADQCGDFSGVAGAISGGLDSTAILMLMHQLDSKRIIPTVSMSIGGREINESENIHAVLEKVRAEPHWVDPDDVNMFDMFGEASWQQECPFYSPSPPI